MSISRCILCNSTNVQSLTFNNIFIIKCNICEFQYIPNNKKYIGEDYFYSYFTKRNAIKHTKLNELRKEQYKIDAKFLSKYITHNSNILDVGCSSGNFLFEIHNQYNLESLIGIDIDKSAIKKANSLYSDIAEYKNIRIYEVDSNEQFDLIIFRGVFQYLDQDLHKSISHIKRLLNENGKIIIFSLPTTDSFIYYLLQDKWALFHPEMSLMFNEKSLRFLCEKYSLVIDDINYPYVEDVYANIDDDYKQVQKIISGRSIRSTPFWGGVMRIVISQKGLV
jgi:SAM-dependent methyltransferase